MVNNLPGSGSQTVVVSVTIPVTTSDALSGTFEVTTITATSLASPTQVIDTAVDTTTALARPLVDVAPDLTDQVNPNTIINYSHIITNLGNLTDVFTITVIPSLGWPVSFTPDPTIVLTPGQSGTIAIRI